MSFKWAFKCLSRWFSLGLWELGCAPPQWYRTTLCTTVLPCAPVTCVVHQRPVLCIMVHKGDLCLWEVGVDSKHNQGSQCKFCTNIHFGGAQRSIVLTRWCTRRVHRLWWCTIQCQSLWPVTIYRKLCSKTCSKWSLKWYSRAFIHSVWKVGYL